MRLLTAVALSLLVLESYQDYQPLDAFQPEQIHISYGDSVRDIVITWSTKNKTDSTVKYGSQNPKGKLSHHYVKVGSSSLFVDGGSLKNSQYIHRVLLDDLKPDKRYEYHVGSALGWSATYWFRTPPKDLVNWTPHLAIFGDMGNVNAQSLGRLQEETQDDMYDAILHVGDFAYDFDTDNGTVGDEFMRQLEPVAAYIPYMTCVGNHEASYNFSHYKARFSMPGPYENLFFSINIGPLHIISFTTEVYYKNDIDLARQEKLQYEWLEKDLMEANKEENRARHPWIFTMGHRPMYCGNKDDDDCTKVMSIVRTGLHKDRSLENLFYRNKVDVEFYAHEHTYERLWPLFNYTVYNGSYSEPYVNPRAPVHVITGSAGCQERTDTFRDPPPYWSALRSTDYGYTRLKVFNKTHLRFQQVSDDQEIKTAIHHRFRELMAISSKNIHGKIVDEWWLVRDFPRVRYPLNI